MTTKTAQQESIASLRKLIADSLAYPPKDSEESLFESTRKPRFHSASPNNLWTLASLLAEPMDRDFISGLYALFLKREPDTAGLHHNLSALLTRRITRPRLAITFAASSEAAKNADAKPNRTILLPLLFLANLVLLLPLIGRIIRTTWRVMVLDTCLREMESTLRITQEDASTLVMQRDDGLEYDKNRVRSH